MSDTSYAAFEHYGTAAQRAAFTPAPPASGQPIYVWYETDTNDFYIYTTAWKGPYALPAIKKIEEVTPSGTGTLTFSSLGSYTNLEIRYSARSTVVALSEDLGLRFNADTGNNYDVAVAYNSSATVMAATEGLAQASMGVGNITGASATAGRPAAGTIRIYDYRGTTFNKEVTAESGNFVGTSSGNWSYRSWIGNWRSTAAITSITLLLPAGNYVAGSKFTLYGIS